jgi:serine/threonine-protein kinase
VIADAAVDTLPPGASASVSEVRGDLEAIVARCLHKDAHDRYPTVAAFAADLRAFLSGHPISALRDQRWYRIRKFAARNRGGVLVGAIAIFSVLTASITIAWQASHLKTERDVAQQARRQSEIDRDRARAVADFLRNTFEAADPGNAAQGGLRAHELVDHAVKRLGELAHQPDTQGELALLLAEIYVQMGLIGQSADLLATHRSAIDSLALIDSEIDWRAKIVTLKVGIQIERDLQRLETQWQGLNAKANTLTKKVQLAHLRAKAYSRTSDFAHAALSLETAWRQFQDALDPAERLRLRVALGQAMLSADRHAEARQISDEIRHTSLTGYAPELQILALRFVARESEFNDADPSKRREAIELWQRTAEDLYGADSLHAASAYVWRVGVTSDAQEREQLMQRGYAIQRAKLPEMSSGMAYAEYNMAAFFGELVRDMEKAEPHYARAVRIGRQIFSRSHSDVRLFEKRWAHALNRLQRHREVLEQLSDPPGDPDAPDDRIKLCGLHLELAAAALAEGRFELGRQSLHHAVALWQPDAEIPDDLAQQIATLTARLDAPAARDLETDD